MNIRDRHGLKSAATEALSGAPNNRMLVLISAGASAGAALVVSLLTFLLDGQIAQTGGLGGLGLRSVLSTVQSLLSMGVGLLLPFWHLGYVSAVLKLSRRESAAPHTLLDGFRRFWSALRLLFLKEFIYMGAILLCIYVGSAFFSLTPLAAPLYEVMLPMLSQSTAPDAATQAAILEAMIPMAIGVLALCCIVLIPLSYRFRMAEFRLMDDSTCGARMALRDSSRMMRRNRFALFRLDLNFWWFYLAQGIVVLLGYGDILLSVLRIELPFSHGTAFFLFYVIGLLAQLVLYYYTQNFVEVTYAKAYDALRNPPAQPPQRARVPWNY